MTSLYDALNLTPKTFVSELSRCANELGLVVSEADFALHWCPNLNKGPLPLGCGSSRPFRTPTAEALWPQWNVYRDPSWLYSHPEYAWDAVGCSAYESNDTIRRGIDDGYMARNIETPTRIIDMGAGPGFTTLMLAKAFPNAEVHHLDCNQELIKIFRWFNDEHAHLANVTHVVKPTGKYDLVVCVEFLEHLGCIKRPGVGDPMSWIDDELESMLMTGGRLMMHSNWSAEASGWLTLGHFLDYIFDGTIISNRVSHNVANAFRKAMISRGWKVDYNPTNRSKAPKLWIKK